MANARFEVLLLALLMLTAAAVIWQDRLLARTIRVTPTGVGSYAHLVISDADEGGRSVTRERGPLRWNCELRAGAPYPYCGYELFFDRDRGVHGLDLTNLRSVTMTILYHGPPGTSFRVNLKNFDPRYSRETGGNSPKWQGVEYPAISGKTAHVKFMRADFGVADWWLRKARLSPEYGHPQFDNVTSINIETGSDAPNGRYAFEVREVRLNTTILTDAEWYSLLLGIWGVMILAYLGYRVSNLRRKLQQRRTLEAVALHQAQQAARHDHLTGILNRRGIIERFAELRERQADPLPIAVVLIDIDWFKALNDTFGHNYADEVLVAVAALIKRSVRFADVAARWGGEEFLVLCVCADADDALLVAEKLRSRIAAFNFGQCKRVTASFGIHWCADPDADLTGLVAHADAALYAAKAAGKNCCKLYRPGMVKAA